MADRDKLDELIDQWKVERPDLEPEVMATVGRVLTVAALIDRQLGAAAGEHGLDRGQGDVLFTLRRSGKPYRLSPSELVASMLVTSGTMTNRLDRLEAQGLIERRPNPEDRRGMDVQLTTKGLRLVDDLITEHVENEEEMLSSLGAKDRDQLDRIMRKLLAGLNQG
jgi:DNA-binding MarR family transcriptional regulator